jgi:hypothetical protein
MNKNLYDFILRLFVFSKQKFIFVPEIYERVKIFSRKQMINNLNVNL